MKTIKRLEIQHHISAPRRPYENPIEVSIQQIKMLWYQILVKRIIKSVWGCGLVCIRETGNIYVSRSKYAKRRSVIEIIAGTTPDISEYLDFSFIIFSHTEKITDMVRLC